MTEILHKALFFAVVGAAMEVHRFLGPGFLEVVYRGALEKELTLRGIPYRSQVELPVYGSGSLGYRRMVRSEKRISNIQE